MVMRQTKTFGVFRSDTCTIKTQNKDNPMNAPVLVRMTKLAGKEDSSYPIGTTVEGPAWKEPELGEPYALDGYIKTSKNERFHWFRTTLVTAIDKAHGFTIIHTNNSQWRIDSL